MNESLTYMAKSAITISLFVTALSGCAYFTKTDDSNLANCPVADLPKDRQPFDASARKNLEQLIASGRNASENSAENPAFVRLDKQGIPLNNQHTKYNDTPEGKDHGTLPWACVKDSRTGLTWEVKTNDQSLRNKHWTYTWYEPTHAGKNSYAGKANGGQCRDESSCDTQTYVAAINAGKLCGFDDWRLPHVFELQTLLNRKDNCPGTCIDQHYFPNAAQGGYWSSSPFEGFMCYAWGVDFELADASGAYKNTPLFIRLVRGQWPTSSAHPEQQQSTNN
ncbi:MAG: DUF1566 domain-containing protein [Gammaproteobacteria bacterium]|nr:DUF1566 domain-containing protein [Gammaproteobacteria bacterium]